jgi:16S rRNA pseudouridine516 synthase
MRGAVRRLDQLLSSLGYCSRKEARALCDAGRVKVKGVLCDDSGERVNGVDVTVDEQPLEFPDGLTVLFHKPVGLVCTHDSREGERIYDVLPERWQSREPKVTSVGRLDKETSGLLIITDDGPLVQRMTSPKHHVEKTYEATLDGALTQTIIEAFARGVALREGAEEVMTLPAQLRALDGNRAEVTVQEGRYHQVRRMFAAHGLHVTALHRTRFGQWTLGTLEPGEWIAARSLHTSNAR